MKIGYPKFTLAVLYLVVAWRLAEQAIIAERDFGLYSGVPCSYLTSLINYVIDCPDVDYVELEGRSQIADGEVIDWKFKDSVLTFFF